MVMKSILVPVEESEVLPSMLETAHLVAQRFGAYIEGLHVRPEISGVVAAGAAGLVAATPGLVESFERQDSENTARSRELFDAFMKEHGVPIDGAGDAPGAGWREEVAPGDEAVGSRGRVFDLIVVGRPVKGASLPAMSTLEAALFDSGRPVIIAPPSPPKTIGETVVVAWNGASETARTIAFGLPFLAGASKVVVLTVDRGSFPGPTNEEAATHLRRLGIDATTVDAAAENAPVGEVILEHCREVGADLLFKGAYTHSRLRQMIFGGVTSYILEAAELPVFMAH